MNILVAYDVATGDTKGQRRLHKVALLCQAYGQRVQNSVFECTINETQYAQFLHKLTRIIDEEQDNLRIYRLREPKEDHVFVYGKRPRYDISEPLIV